MPSNASGAGAAAPAVPSTLDLVRLSPRRLFPPGGEDLYRQIALLTDMEEGQEVLDVACGKGVAVEYFVGLLDAKENPVVNQAGFALGYLEDPSAIGPLIRSLITTHKFRVKQGDPNQTSTGFDSRGNVGFSAGGSDKIVAVHTQNRAVLDALVKLTGQAYGYDIGLWNTWHANQRRYEHINPRRD